MEYKLNKELTIELFEKCKMDSYIEKNSCYSNTFKATCFGLLDYFTQEKFKVALCYVSTELEIWIRHAVVVTEDGDILDFTFAIDGGDFYMTNYEIVKVFDLIEYNSMIQNSFNEEKEVYICDFPNLKEEHEFYFNKLREKFVFQLAEHDYFNYIVPLIRDYGYPDDVKKKVQDWQNSLRSDKEVVINGKSN